VGKIRVIERIADGCAQQAVEEETWPGRRGRSFRTLPWGRRLIKMP